MSLKVQQLTADQWRCTECRIVNATKDAYCVACEAPQDKNAPRRDRPLFAAGLFGPSSSTGGSSGISFGLPFANSTPTPFGGTSASSTKSNLVFGLSGTPDRLLPSRPTIFGLPEVAEQSASSHVPPKSAPLKFGLPHDSAPSSTSPDTICKSALSTPGLYSRSHPEQSPEYTSESLSAQGQFVASQQHEATPAALPSSSPAQIRPKRHLQLSEGPVSVKSDTPNPSPPSGAEAKTTGGGGRRKRSRLDTGVSDIYSPAVAATAGGRLRSDAIDIDSSGTSQLNNRCEDVPIAKSEDCGPLSGTPVKLRLESGAARRKARLTGEDGSSQRPQLSSPPAAATAASPLEIASSSSSPLITDGSSVGYNSAPDSPRSAPLAPDQSHDIIIIGADESEGREEDSSVQTVSDTVGAVGASGKAHRYTFGMSSETSSLITSPHVLRPGTPFGLASGSVAGDDDDAAHLAVCETTPTFGSAVGSAAALLYQSQQKSGDKEGASELHKEHLLVDDEETTSAVRISEGDKIAFGTSIIDGSDSLSNLIASKEADVTTAPSPALLKSSSNNVIGLDEGNATEDWSTADKAVGIAYSWGSGECDQLAVSDSKLNDLGDCPTPAIIPRLRRQKIVSVACGALHTTALFSDGTVATWGCNDDYALGRPTGEGAGKERSPERVIGLPADDLAVAVNCGDCHSACLLESGKCYIWGSYKDNAGYIGFPDYSKMTGSITAMKQLAPVQVPGLKGRCFKLVCGENHTGVLTISSPIAEAYLSLQQERASQNATQPKSLYYQSPITINDDDTLSTTHTTNGVNMFLWGNGEFGQLGRPPFPATETDRTPYLYPQHHTAKSLGLENEEIVNLFSGRATVFFETVTRSTEDETNSNATTSKVYGMGRNSNGELSSVVSDKIVDLPVELPAFRGMKIEAIEGCQFAAVLLTADGKVYTWGRKDALGLGLSPSDGEQFVSLPQRVKTVPPIRQIGAGGDTMFATTTGGVVVSWGDGQMNQLGDGVERLQPALLPVLIPPSSFDSAFVLSVSGGSQHAVAIVYNNESVPRRPFDSLLRKVRCLVLESFTCKENIPPATRRQANDFLSAVSPLTQSGRAKRSRSAAGKAAGLSSPNPEGKPIKRPRSSATPQPSSVNIKGSNKPILLEEEDAHTAADINEDIQIDTSDHRGDMSGNDGIEGDADYGDGTESKPQSVSDGESIVLTEEKLEMEIDEESSPPDGVEGHHGGSASDASSVRASPLKTPGTAAARGADAVTPAALGEEQVSAKSTRTTGKRKATPSVTGKSGKLDADSVTATPAASKSGGRKAAATSPELVSAASNRRSQQRSAQKAAESALPEAEGAPSTAKSQRATPAAVSPQGVSARSSRSQQRGAAVITTTCPADPPISTASDDDDDSADGQIIRLSQDDDEDIEEDHQSDRQQNDTSETRAKDDDSQSELRVEGDEGSLSDVEDDRIEREGIDGGGSGTKGGSKTKEKGRAGKKSAKEESETVAITDTPIIAVGREMRPRAKAKAVAKAKATSKQSAKQSRTTTATTARGSAKVKAKEVEAAENDDEKTESEDGEEAEDGSGGSEGEADASHTEESKKRTLSTAAVKKGGRGVKATANRSVSPHPPSGKNKAAADKKKDSTEAVNAGGRRTASKTAEAAKSRSRSRSPSPTVAKRQGAAGRSASPPVVAATQAKTTRGAKTPVATGGKSASTPAEKKSGKAVATKGQKKETEKPVGRSAKKAQNDMVDSETEEEGKESDDETDEAPKKGGKQQGAAAGKAGMKGAAAKAQPKSTAKAKAAAKGAGPAKETATRQTRLAAKSPATQASGGKAATSSGKAASSAKTSAAKTGGVAAGAGSKKRKIEAEDDSESGTKKRVTRVKK